MQVMLRRFLPATCIQGAHVVPRLANATSVTGGEGRTPRAPISRGRQREGEVGGTKAADESRSDHTKVHATNEPRPELIHNIESTTSHHSRPLSL